VRPDLARSGSWIGMSGLAVALFLYGYTAIVLPGLLFSVLLPVLWLVLFTLGCRWFLAHPYRVLVLPVLAVGAWFAVALTGR
jgi:hypothetical protein